MNQEKEKKKMPLKIILLVLAVIVILLAGGLVFYVHGISAADPGNKKDVVISIESGSSILHILDQLDEAGLVQNKFCGKVFVKLSSPKNIQANTYILHKDMTLTEIFDAMNSGDPAYISQSKFTIIEGAKIPEAAESISKQTGIAAEDILAKWKDQDYLKSLIDKYWFLTEEILDPGIKYPLEGYLYPETYFLPVDNINIETLTASILDKTASELEPIKDRISSKLDMTVHEFLTFASVVERESLFEEDRPKIAGVFKNRLDRNMALQSDITVLYALDRTGVNVSIAETKTDSPYNTYVHQGLPVGPICAVPKRTMEDCLNYEPSDYLFFFATEDGKVLYSKTYEEHQKIVNENKWY